MIHVSENNLIIAEPTIMEVRTAGAAYLSRTITDPAEAFRCASLLLMHVLDLSSYSDLLLHALERINNTTNIKYNILLERKSRGEPVQYITGVAPFMDLVFDVKAGCLIPRPETELLVQHVIDHLKTVAGEYIVLDIGTGSGNIAIALAHYLKNIHIDASDISQAALDIAQHNACKNGVDRIISFYQGFLFNAVPHDKRYTVIVSNPPYVAHAEFKNAQPELRFEPHEALIAERDGMAIIEEIIANAYEHLQPGGSLFLEIGHRHGSRVNTLLKNKGYCNGTIIKDHSRHDRIAFGQRSL